MIYTLFRFVIKVDAFINFVKQAWLTCQPIWHAPGDYE